METKDFIVAFEGCTLPPQSFSHEAHIRLAWLYLQEHSAPVTWTKVSEGLKRYTHFLGAEEKYHETITGTYVLLIHERIESIGKGHTWEDFIESNPDLFDREKPIIQQYYHQNTLSSDLARKAFVFPDKHMTNSQKS